MRRAKRNAAKLLSAAMAVGMMAGMAVPAAAEEESTNIWASDVDTSEPMELKMYLIGDQRKIFRLMHLAFGMLFQKWHGIRQKLTAKFIWSQIIQTSLDRMFWQFAAT